MNRAHWQRWVKALPAERPALMASLIAENEGLIQSFVHRFMTKARAYPASLRPDLEQAARIGFMVACQRWKPAKGRFSTLAFYCMRQEMQEAACEMRPIGLPRDVMFASTHKTEVHEAQYGTEPPAEALGRREKALKRVLGWTFFFAPNGPDVLTHQGDERAERRGALEIPDAEGDLDRKRDVGYLRAYLAMMPPEDQDGFWSGKRPDLVEEAKEYVEAWRRGDY